MEGGEKSVSRDYFIKNCLPSHEERVLECDPDALLKEQLNFEPQMLNGSQAKTAFAIRENAERLIREDGIESVVFMTLTVGDWKYQDGERRFQQVHNAEEASRRINNLNRRLLGDLFERAIIVTERHKSGAVHFHILGSLKGFPDVRTGFDWKRFEKGDYRFVSERLRRIWGVLRERLPEYGFGRAETCPIRTCSGALSRYVAKYIQKNVSNRMAEDKRKKLVRYWGWEKSQLKPNDFGWAGPKACAWRAKTRQVCAVIGIYEPEQAKEFFGPHWAFHVSQVWSRLFGGRDIYPGLIMTANEYISLKDLLTQKREFLYKLHVEKSVKPTYADWFLELLDDPNYLAWIEGEFGDHNSDSKSQTLAA